MIYVVATAFVIVCVLLIVVVLLQKGRGGGLGAAFGGAASSAFGTRIGDVFTWVTIVLVGLFLLLAVGTTMLFRPPRKQVDAPEFTPPGSSSTEPEMVTIFCETETATIYYTTDGSDPDEDAIKYTEAVKVEPETTLRARAYQGGWDPSTVTQGYYGPPILEEIVPPGEETTVPPVEIPSPTTAPETMIPARRPAPATATAPPE